MSSAWNLFYSTEFYSFYPGKELDIQYLGLHYEFYIKDLTQHLVIKALDIQEINLHKLGLQ